MNKKILEEMLTVTDKFSPWFSDMKTSNEELAKEFTNKSKQILLHSSDLTSEYHTITGTLDKAQFIQVNKCQVEKINEARIHFFYLKSLDICKDKKPLNFNPKLEKSTILVPFKTEIPEELNISPQSYIIGEEHLKLIQYQDRFLEVPSNNMSLKLLMGIAFSIYDGTYENGKRKVIELVTKKNQTPFGDLGIYSSLFKAS